METTISKSQALEKTTNRTKIRQKDPSIANNMKKIATTALKKMPRFETRTIDAKTNLK
jgi:hypothetical protein